MTFRDGGGWSDLRKSHDDRRHTPRKSAISRIIHDIHVKCGVGCGTEVTTESGGKGNEDRAKGELLATVVH